MTTPETDPFQQQLESVVGTLRNWVATEDSDSIRVQNMRQGDAQISAERLEHIIEGLPEDRSLLLTIGDTSSHATVFRKNAYDFLEESWREVLPGESVALLQAHWVVNALERRRQAYFGNYFLEFSVSGLAKAIASNSKLRITSSDEAKRIDRGI